MRTPSSPTPSTAPPATPADQTARTIRTAAGQRTTARQRAARSHLGADLLEDWEHIVRRTPTVDMDGLLSASGFRRFTDRSAGEHSPHGAEGLGSGGSDRHDAETVDAETVDADDPADHVLAQLVADAAHCTLAARVVLQRLLPGLLAIAKRHSYHQRALTVRLYNELLGNAWIVIRCYPIERRPRRVAANLLRDVEYQTFVREARLRRVPTELWDTNQWDRHGRAGYPSPTGADPHPFAEVVEVLHRARAAGAHEDTLGLAAALVSGRTLGELAAEHGRTERTERYRRARMVSELRSLVLDAPDAHQP